MPDFLRLQGETIVQVFFGHRSRLDVVQSIDGDCVGGAKG